MASNAYIGAIFMFAGNFAPRNYMLCQGQILSIQQYPALFSILGTTYGGNGVTTFSLPDLRGRVPVGQGQGAGLSSYVLGEQTGSETVTLLTANMPAHSHAVAASTSSGTQSSPSNAYLAGVVGSASHAPPDFPAIAPNAYVTTTPNATMGASMIGTSGSGAAHSNLQPLLCINYIIAVVGLYPSRN